MSDKITIRHLSAFFGEHRALTDINLRILTAFLRNGELIGISGTNQIFTNPARRATEDYVTGRFG